MTRKTLPIAALTLLALLAGAPAQANWLHFTDSIFDAQGSTEAVKHPPRLVRIIVLPTDATGGLIEVCIGYINNLEKGERGKITANVTITDPDDNVTTFSLGGAVSRGVFGECREVAELSAGTILEFDFRFKKFARLRGNERFQVAAAVAINGVNVTDRDVGLTPDDQRAVVTLRRWVGGSRGAALRRESRGWTVDWRDGGMSFELGPTFATIALAVDAWCAVVECPD